MSEPISYPFPERALKKWSDNFLTPPGDEKAPFAFIYEGSTCRNGGVPFRARFTLTLDGAGIIRNPAIEILDKDGERHMCGSAYASHPGPEGESMEAYLARDIPLNFAGCLCYPAQINQKWKMVVSTIHYFLNGKDVKS